MTREPEQQTQPSYLLAIQMTAVEARPFIRSLYKLIKHFQPVAELRGSNNKTGYRLVHAQESAYCDLTYAYDSKSGSFNIQTHFRPGASSTLVGRMLTLLALIIRYHDQIGKPLRVIPAKTTFNDKRTIEQWGDWATKQLLKKFPGEFPELGPVVPVKF